MAEWFLVAITAVYVVATIFISKHNNRTSRATLDMLEESKRQFNEENRPIITVELILEKRAFYAIRFTNNGKRSASHVRVEFQQVFLDSIIEAKTLTLLEVQKGRELVISVGQHYDLPIGTNRYFTHDKEMPVTGTLFYQHGAKMYKEPFSIDVVNYATFFSVKSETEDLIKKIDEQNKELKRIADTLNEIYLASVKRGEQNND